MEFLSLRLKLAADEAVCDEKVSTNLLMVFSRTFQLFEIVSRLSSGHCPLIAVLLLSVPPAPEEFPVVPGPLPQLQGPGEGGECSGAAQATHEQVQGATNFQRRSALLFLSLSLSLSLSPVLHAPFDSLLILLAR